jgi:hypothetical protein
VIHSPAWEPTLFSWNDRKRITITGSVDGAKTNYQKPLTIHYGAGADAGSDIYLNEKCLPDFADIRFTNNAGAPLFYWVESYTYGVSALVWVRWDSIPASPATADFWIYFNNGLAISASYGAGTFIKFEDFEWGINGTSIAVSGGSIAWWTWGVTPTISTDHAYGGTRSGKQAGGGASGCAFAFAHTTGVALRIRIWKEDLADACYFFLWGDGIRDIYPFADSIERIGYIDSAGASQFTTTITKDSWVDVFEIRNVNWIAHTFDMVKNDVVVKVGATMRNTAFFADSIALSMNDGVAGHDFYVENILIRNWTPNEPTFSAYGPDEPYETFYGITSLKELAAAMIKGDMLFSDGAKLARRASGSIGSIFTTHDVGADPTWTYPP